MKRLTIYISTLIVISASLNAQVRKDSLPSEQIDVVKAFEPSVTLVNKVGFPPNLPKLSTDQPLPQQYNFTDRYTSVSYKPEDLRPLKYTAPVEAPQGIGYVRAGFGNYLTPVFNLALSNKDHSKFSVGLNTDFIFSKANEPRFQEYYELGVKANAAYHTENMTISLDAGIRRDQYYLYGIDGQDSLQDVNKKDISRAYTIPSFMLSVFNHVPTKADIDYKAYFGVDAAGTDFDVKASNVSFGASGEKGFSGGDYKAGLKLNAMLSTYNFEGSDGRFALELTPFGGIRKGIWSLEAGPVLVIDDGDVHLMPYISNRIKVKEDKLVIYNEWKSSIGFNNLVTAYRQNPFLARDNRYENYRFEERTLLGVRGAIPSGLFYNFRFGQAAWNDMPLWLNDTSDFSQFRQVYDKKVRGWNPYLELGYKKQGLFDISLAGDYYIYTTDQQAEAWHLPSLQGQLLAHYYWKDKLQVGMQILAQAGMKARNELGAVENLKPLVDINLSANYFLNKNIGFFVEVNNIANIRSPRWYRYDRFGIQGIGGVKVVF